MAMFTPFPQLCVLAQFSKRPPYLHLLSLSPHSAQLSKQAHSISTHWHIAVGRAHPSLSQLTGTILHKIRSEVQAQLKSAGQLTYLHNIQTQFSSFLSPFITSSLVLLLYAVQVFFFQESDMWGFFFTTKGHCYFNYQLFPVCPNTLSQLCHYQNCSSISGATYRQYILTDLMVLTSKKSKVSPPTHLFCYLFHLVSKCQHLLSAKWLLNQWLWCGAFPLSDSVCTMTFLQHTRQSALNILGM